MVKRSLFLTFLLSWRSMFAVGSSSPREAADTERIYDGNLAATGEFPYFALLVFENSDYACGGVLIGPRHVLTQAYCIAGDLGNVTGVYVGGTTSRTDGIYFPVSSTTVHPSYVNEFDQNGDSVYRNDIGIVVLDGVVPSSIPRPSIRRAPSVEGVTLTTMGFGWYDENQILSNYLLKMTSVTKTDQYCETSVGAIVYVYNEHMCLEVDETVSTPGTYPCFYDWGAPAIDVSDPMNPVVWGIMITAGFCNGSDGTYNILFNDVWNYASWIDTIIPSTTPSPTGVSTPAPTRVINRPPVGGAVTPAPVPVPTDPPLDCFNGWQRFVLFLTDAGRYFRFWDV
jgi:Trypsin